MEKNVGAADRIIRVVLGAVIIIGGYLYLAGWQAIVAYALGAGTLATGVIGHCTLYTLLGISTAKCAHCEAPPVSQNPQA
ncbi:MAG: DUF2892 domain-containing protein [Candidatus Niyogibacteria bacterium]|nr:DUF2892 domain-containing protein [Candidatus Niyogibacteria bacterium]